MSNQLNLIEWIKLSHLCQVFSKLIREDSELLSWKKGGCKKYLKKEGNNCSQCVFEKKNPLIS